MTNENQVHTSVGQLLFYWMVVGVPLAWGVYNTVLKLQALFK